MAANGATTAQQVAERNRRQRAHAQFLHERTGRRQLVRRVEAENKLCHSRTRIAAQVGVSKERGLLARVKSMRAAERTRTAARRARSRALEQSKRNREERKQPCR